MTSKSQYQSKSKYISISSYYHKTRFKYKKRKYKHFSWNHPFINPFFNSQGTKLNKNGGIRFHHLDLFSFDSGFYNHEYQYKYKLNKLNYFASFVIDLCNRFIFLNRYVLSYQRKSKKKRYKHKSKLKRKMKRLFYSYKYKDKPVSISVDHSNSNSFLFFRSPFIFCISESIYPFFLSFFSFFSILYFFRFSFSFFYFSLFPFRNIL